jgi:hypothetical protein
MDYKFLGFHPMLSRAIKQLADQEEAFIKVRMVCGEPDLNKYSKIPTLQLNVMRRHLLKGESSEEAFNYSQKYMGWLKKISTETAATQEEAEYICDMMDDKQYGSVFTFVIYRYYLWGLLDEIKEEINNQIKE